VMRRRHSRAAERTHVATLLANARSGSSPACEDTTATKHATMDAVVATVARGAAAAKRAMSAAALFGVIVRARSMCVGVGGSTAQREGVVQ